MNNRTSVLTRTKAVCHNSWLTRWANKNILVYRERTELTLSKRSYDRKCEVSENIYFGTEGMYFGTLLRTAKGAGIWSFLLDGQMGTLKSWSEPYFRKESLCDGGVP